MYILKNNQQGVTLLETIFALAVLVTGILAVLTLATSSISLSQSSEQSIVVTNLAREGLEIVREIRDYTKGGDLSKITGSSFFNASMDKCYFVDVNEAGNFKLQTANSFACTNLNSLSTCTNCLLYKDQTSGKYTHTSSGVVTVFRRAVQIKTISTTEKEVLSRVVWTEHGRSHSFLLVTNLTDW